MPVVLFFYYGKKKEEKSLNTKLLHTKEPLPRSRFDSQFLGQGSLALCTTMEMIPFPDCSEKIVILAKNTRPDAALYPVQFHIALKGDSRFLKVNSGQRLYLSTDDKQLTFSQKSTSLWVTPFSDEKGATRLQIGLTLLNNQGEKVIDEVRELQLEQRSSAKDIEDIVNAEFKTASYVLKEGKWWGPDKLFEKYGGKEFETYKKKERIEIASKQGKKILFIKENKTFIWKDEDWVPSIETKGFPIAQVCQIAPHRIEWKLWDATGMESILLTFSKEQPHMIAMRMQDVFKQIRKRTHFCVSCKIDQRVMTLKKGDWLIHTSTGWRKIRDYHEMENLLRFAIQGELFIFDGLEKVDEKEMFCGTFFHPMRTVEHLVRFPIEQGKNRDRSTLKKKVFLDNSNPLKR